MKREKVLVIEDEQIVLDNVKKFSPSGLLKEKRR